MKKVLLAGIGTFMLISAFHTAPAAVAASQAYVQADKSGNALAAKTKAYEQAIGTKKMSVIDSQYNGVLNAIKSTEILIGKVSGASRRQALLTKYISPAKAARDKTTYEISQYRLLEKMETRIYTPDYKIDQDLGVLDRLKRRTAEVKKSANLPALDPEITNSLLKKEAVVEGEYTSTYIDGYRILIDQDKSIYYANNMYDYLKKHISETDKRIGYVSGRTTRNQLLEAYIQPGKKEIARSMYEISRYRLMSELFKLAQSSEQAQKDKAKARLPELDALKKKAEDLKKTGVYKPLPEQILNDLNEDEVQLREIINGK
ncbi:hypothetical protein [Metabacillus sp. 84]|uniref:hypothetical protein n=1 Tax=Metabacillus sp. 84 TaxID=3404705 RepID=UPI003CF18B28